MSIYTENNKHITVFGEHINFLYSSHNNTYDVLHNGKSVSQFSFPSEITKNWLNLFMECWCFNKNFRKPFLNKVNHVGCFEQLPKLPQYTDRQIKENSKSLKKEVDAINNDEANAKSLFYLKSGRDRFSSFKEKDFEFLLDFKTLKNKHINQFNNKDKLKTLRWICRGLSVNNAIRKVQIDLDINENWKQSRNISTN